MNHVQTRTAALATDERVEEPGPGQPQNSDGEQLYEVPLTAADLQLIEAFSNWFCGVGPAPDIRARFDHLAQQLACAQPARTTSHP